MVQLLTGDWHADAVWASGWLGFCMSLLNTQMSSAWSMAFVQLCTNATYAWHYILIGAWSGFITQLLGVITSILKLLEEGRPTCKSLQFYVPFVLIPLGAYTYQRPLDLLPMSAVAGRLASFQASDMRTMRLVRLVSSTPWVPYAIALESYSALSTGVVSITLQLLTIIRIDFRGSKQVSAKDGAPGLTKVASMTPSMVSSAQPQACEKKNL